MERAHRPRQHASQMRILVVKTSTRPVRVMISNLHLTSKPIHPGLCTSMSHRFKDKYQNRLQSWTRMKMRYKPRIKANTWLDGWLDEAVQLYTIQHINTFHTTSACRRHVKNVIKNSKNIKIIEFHHYIWDHCEKCIKISTNMPSVRSVIHKINDDILRR